jgi:photosystem II stability/assembly factor-like uncharacterized protein
MMTRERPARFPGRIVVAALLLLTAWDQLSAQPETIYMSVLNSRKHGWARLDNPLIGLFVSTDGGNTWQHEGWREYIRMFYTEQGPDGTLWSACGNGVLRSTDQGSSWRITTDWRVTEVLKVKVDPSKASTVFAATAYGVIRSRDRGEHWDMVRPRFAGDICIDRGDNKHIFAATEEGISVSRDGGSTWSIAGLPGLGVRVICQSPHSTSTFVAGTEDDGIFLSTDGGGTWSQRSEGLNHKTVYAFAFDRSNPEVLWAGTHGGGVYGSTDGGKFWMQRSAGLTNLDVHTLVVARGSMLFAGTLNGGLFRSADGGKSWEFNSQEEAQVWGLSVAPGGIR